MQKWHTVDVIYTLRKLVSGKESLSWREFEGYFNIIMNVTHVTANWLKLFL